MNNTQLLNQILSQLVDIPYRYSAPIIGMIHAELQRQHEAAADKRDEPSGAPAPEEEQ